MNDRHFETTAAAHQWQHSEQPQPICVPIYASSTFKTGTVEHACGLAESKDEGYFYTRWNNPTVEAAAQALNKLEGGAGTMMFSSGMAAISTALLATLHAGDHVVAPKVVYSGTLHLIKNLLPMYGIEVSLIDAGKTADIIQAYKDAVKENTKVLYGETPCNPMMTILDLEEFGRLGKSFGRNIVTMVDSTFASPFIQNPVRHGVDVVIHSCSKYIGGHSDIIAGAITAATPELAHKIHDTQKILGGCLSPFDGFLLLRGIKTLHVRMERHSANAMDIASFLQNHPKVTTVHYPGLSTHPHHSLAKKQMKHFGGMLCFEVKGGLAEATTFVESLKVIKLAVSLGGTDSLAEVVSVMTHTDKYMTPEMKEEGGIKDSLVRISIGLEHVDDLKKDIQQALEKIP
ncbi:uncharacterized protein LOC116299492 [Actinia tenebrosa]|uniref:plant cystathionine gamma-synthase n=1 Tax=Actinia tenebrosa TaxID=6105 RepID=A0A6P8ID78_ACTTE|nr:uncharacterized protein LOC116299492 [Actinia tenebrosa]